MRLESKPDVNGFIKNWLIAGPVEELYDAPENKEVNQLAYEAYMRSVFADDEMKTPPDNIELGGETALKMPWRYYRAGENIFIDVSRFYHLLTRVELYAATEIVSPSDVTVKVRLWSYTAADLWLNGNHICKIKAPVYKPIDFRDVELNLKEGTNRIFIRIQNLGVRDTRNMTALQIREGADKFIVTLPDKSERVAAAWETDRFLSGLRVAEGRLISETPPPVEITIKTNTGVIKWADGTSVTLPHGTINAELSAAVSGQRLRRAIELAENIKALYTSELHMATPTHRADVIKTLTKTIYDDKAASSIYYTLARLIAGDAAPDDFDIIYTALDKIDKREDCADFYLACLLRMYAQFPLDSIIKARIKKSVLNFRYWMDENGQDGMCFWSENHALLFHGCQMIAGQLFPDDVFARSGRTGAQQAVEGKRRCREWLELILDEGFEEFSSGGYTPITLAALLNVVDFAADASLSEMATEVIDRCLYTVALQSFDGIPLAPMGRVYRDVITPHLQKTQAILHLISRKTPECHSLWLAPFGKTKYVLPDDLEAKINETGCTTYTTGGALITVKKTGAYMMTSAASPRQDLSERRKPAAETEYYRTKCLNELYHGTSFFVPGEYGYQQHMWYAALSRDCVVFTNHPGATTDETTMRPGYWHGNGIFPAVKQDENELGVIYRFRDEYPIHFSHLYWPEDVFDETAQQNGWLFGRCGASYIGVWCSTPTVKHSDVLQNREYRAYGESMAWFTVCSDESESGSFQAFCGKCVGKAPSFDESELKLSADGFDMGFK